MVNLSACADAETARTNPECAAQRAEHLAVLGVCSVLELCVGPSLRALEAAYAVHGIHVTGNDIDPRWRRYYPQGAWVLGDALSADLRPFDAVVFAPPVTCGCTGRRSDALSIDSVRPSYREFLRTLTDFTGTAVLVLPARSWATSTDRREYYALLASIRAPYEVAPLFAERRQIRKYIDVYVFANKGYGIKESEIV